MVHESYVALFDVLGFEERLTTLGLGKIVSRYEALIEVVDYRKQQIEHVFARLGFSEAPYWTAEGDVFIFSKTHGAYASDSILLWSNRIWPEVAQDSKDTFRPLARHPADGWKYYPIPADNFLDVCNELMCRGLEVGLPLRGAIAAGEAVLDQSRSIFLGGPIIEAARLEGDQRFISASFCASMASQVIPRRFCLEFDKHIKETHRSVWGGALLDWPRHWRNTREADLGEVISRLNTDERYATYYENTLEMIAFSNTLAGQFEGQKDTSVRTQYEQFSWSNSQLTVRTRAIRRVRVERDV